MLQNARAPNAASGPSKRLHPTMVMALRPKVRLTVLPTGPLGFRANGNRICVQAIQIRARIRGRTAHLNQSKEDTEGHRLADA